MNYIDIIIIVLLIFAAISGFSKGLVSELVSLAALILGVWGTIEFSDITADFLVENFKLGTKHLTLISFAVTFVVIVILVHIVGNVVNKMIDTLMMGFLNKLAGMFFGVVKSALILSIILMVFDKIDEDVSIIPGNAKEESRLYEPIRNFAPSIFPFMDLWNDDEVPEEIETA